MPTLTILNPAAGRGRAREVWEMLRARTGEPDSQLHVTTAPGEAEDVARAALLAGTERIFVVGGDGTFNEVLNGFFVNGAALNPAAVLVAVAAGTGCDLVRTLAGMPAPGGFSAMDVGKVTCVGADGGERVRYFANVASCGQSARVAAAVKRMPRWCGGPAAYLLAILESLATYQPVAVSLSIDGVAGDPRRVRCVALANGRAFGGGLTIAPDARVDSGALDLAVIGAAPRRWLLRNLGAIYRGDHAGMPHISHAQAQQIDIRSAEPVAIEADGEVIGSLPARVELLAGAVRVALPGHVFVG
jgi:YegS/Rv2252/BmrU family lipid kinase